VDTRDRVARLAKRGLSGRQIAAELEISRPTVSYHLRNLGKPPDMRCNRRYDWAGIQRYYDEGHSITECHERFGFATEAWNSARRRGAVVSRPQAMPSSSCSAAGGSARISRCGSSPPGCFWSRAPAGVARVVHTLFTPGKRARTTMPP
jgi:Bacterial regulatory protein, arsR family